jgi:hypothetical protein
MGVTRYLCSCGDPIAATRYSTRHPRALAAARCVHADTFAKNSNAEVVFQTILLETEEPPKYQKIAERALQLNKLGLCNEAIARHIGVDGKTVAKALTWILDRS